MGMTPDQFFEAFVEGNVDDFHDDPGDVRKAFNAAVSASHMADQYFQYNKRHNPNAVSKFQNMGRFVEHLSNETNGAFRDIRSIANAYKHLYTNPAAGGNSSVDSTGSIESVEFAGEEVSEVETDYEAEERRVVFRRKDGTMDVFLRVLDQVVDYFRTITYGIS